MEYRWAVLPVWAVVIASTASREGLERAEWRSVPVAHLSNDPSYPPSARSRPLTDDTSMATASLPPAALSPTKADGFTSAGRNAPATNGHYVNGSATASDPSSERIQIVNDEKEFKCVYTTAMCGIYES